MNLICGFESGEAVAEFEACKSVSKLREVAKPDGAEAIAVAEPDRDISPPSLLEDGNDEPECNLPSLVEDESIPSTDAAISVAVVAFALVAALSEAAVAAAAADDATAAVAAAAAAEFAAEAMSLKLNFMPATPAANP